MVGIGDVEVLLRWGLGDDEIARLNASVASRRGAKHSHAHMQRSTQEGNNKLVQISASAFQRCNAF